MVNQLEEDKDADIDPPQEESPSGTKKITKKPREDKKASKKKPKKDPVETVEAPPEPV